MRLPVLALLLITAAAPSCLARVLEVGEGGAYALPSDAVKAARDGDTIHIAQGEFFDCISTRLNHLTITGSGPDTVLTDRACDGKGIVVLDGDDVTISALAIVRARVPDGNGAGIRAEGGDLTLDHVRLLNNQVGLLATPRPGAKISITRSYFGDNGACNERSCQGAIAVEANAARLELIESVVHATHGGHAITSSAASTLIVRSKIADDETGSSGYLLLVHGNLDLRGSVLEKGLLTSNTDAAVHAEAPFGKAVTLSLNGNHFTDDSGDHSALLRNWTSSDAELIGNKLDGTDTAETSSGKNLHRVYALALDTKAALRHLAGIVYHSAADILHAARSALGRG